MADLAEVSPFFVPFERNTEIIMRKAIFGSLEKILPLTEHHQSAALWGLGGSG